MQKPFVTTIKGEIRMALKPNIEYLKSEVFQFTNPEVYLKVVDLAQIFDCSEQTIYKHLKDFPPIDIPEPRKDKKHVLSLNTRPEVFQTATRWKKKTIVKWLKANYEEYL